MNARLKKTILLVLAVALLVGVSVVQRAMNRDRDRLGLTRAETLENAPPVLAFTTVALGGFRGLIANALWARAQDLQQDDKFAEMAQLASWITKLEPHFVQVWIFQEWNMAWNISVKFKDYNDRWIWVQRGIKLIRDEGLRYNPSELLLFRELAWIFQNKIGANLDDASMYYKRSWAAEMEKVLGGSRTNLDELINPQTDELRARRTVLLETYKLDPVFMKRVDELHGPLEWRLPEAHAIYWAEKGLEQVRVNPDKVKREDIISLHRVVYQSMHLSVQRGRLSLAMGFDFGPNLEVIRKAVDSYEQAIEEDPGNKDIIGRAYRNMLRDAVYFLYLHNRQAEAAQWYKFLAEKFPKDHLLDGDMESLPGKLSLDDYVVARVGVDIKETNRDLVKSAIEGLLVNAYRNLVVEEEGRAITFRGLARRVWKTYQDKLPPTSIDSHALPSLEVIDKEVIDMLLDPQRGWPEQVRTILRGKLRLPAEVPPAPDATNALPSAVSGTNAPAVEAR